MNQLLPALSDLEYQALKFDIANRGVMVPIEVDADTGVVLDGFHRMRACEELGITPPVVARHFADDAAQQEHALLLNLLRRQMGPVIWANAFKVLCQVRGVRLGEGGDRKSPDKLSGDSVESLAEGLGVDPRTARRRLALSEKLAAHPDLARKVDNGEMAAQRALRVAREREAEQQEDPPPVVLPASIDVRYGDFRLVLTDVCDADLIITDPPYPKEYLPLWSDLGAFAARTLKPGRLLVAYTGQYWLPEVIVRLGEHLAYVWCGFVGTAGPHNLVHPYHIRSCAKPILLFSNGQYEPDEWIDDVVNSAGKQKGEHAWQQSLDPFIYYISRLTRPGDLIVDPFVGTGTTAIAARDLMRRFIGCDLDESVVEKALQRLAE